MKTGIQWGVGHTKSWTWGGKVLWLFLSHPHGEGGGGSSPPSQVRRGPVNSLEVLGTCKKGDVPPWLVLTELWCLEQSRGQSRAPAQSTWGKLMSAIWGLAHRWAPGCREQCPVSPGEIFATYPLPSPHPPPSAPEEPAEVIPASSCLTWRPSTCVQAGAGGRERLNWIWGWILISTEVYLNFLLWRNLKHQSGEEILVNECPIPPIADYHSYWHMTYLVSSLCSIIAHPYWIILKQVPVIILFGVWALITTSKS